MMEKLDCFGVPIHVGDSVIISISRYFSIETVRKISPIKIKTSYGYRYPIELMVITDRQKQDFEERMKINN